MEREMKAEQRSEELYESLDLFISAWQAFAEEFYGTEVTKRENLFVAWADTELPFYNTIFLTEAVTDASRFRLLVDEAVAVTSRKKMPGLLTVCNDLLSGSAREEADAILAERGYTIRIPMTGMLGEPFPLALMSPAALRIERSYDGTTVTEMNTVAYHMPAELGRSSVLTPGFWQDAYTSIGYEDDRAVCTATTMVLGNVLYLALVATVEDARKKGYGEAVVRHSLQTAHQATGLTRTILHATEDGRPVYTRLGYRPVGDFTWYMQDHS
jgi:GNAT superfamily N-acetyltransferase